MSLEIIAVLALALAAFPAVMTFANLSLYRVPPSGSPRRRIPVSVLIPARNEEAAIADAVEAALANRGADIEVIVLDDNSQDGTAAIVEAIAARDPCVRLIRSPRLPRGWCGKQHACAVLAQEARHPILLFHDADVRLSDDAVARLLRFMEDSGAELVSGIPLQRTGTWLEKLIIPVIHFVLLGFLPIAGMRRSRRPAFGAGCGQLFVATREAYEKVGGHAAIRAAVHDGLALPRAFREAGFRTDLVDLTPVAECRMYHRAADVWEGFAKNAHEGMGSRGGIVPWSLILLGGQVLPVALLGVASSQASAFLLALMGTLVVYATRLALVVRFRQSWLGAVLHPVGVLLVVAVQWYALARRLSGRPVAWKGRVPA